MLLSFIYIENSLKCLNSHINQKDITFIKIE